MVNPDPDKQETTTTETDSHVVDSPQAAAPATDLQSQQIAELRQLGDSLVAAVVAIQAQSARDAEFREAIDDVKRTTREMLSAAMVSGISPISRTDPAPIPAADDCGEGPCDCVSAQCCCFDIIMSSVRVLAMQLEPGDSTLIPMDNLEIKMFAYLDGGIGAVIPSMFSTLSLPHKLAQHAGLKVRLDRPIGTVCLRKGKTKTVTIGVDVIEEDSGLERPVGGRDEEGSNSGTMILECCCSVPPSTVFDISFTGGGQGGGAIECAFTAVRKC